MRALRRTWPVGRRGAARTPSPMAASTPLSCQSSGSYSYLGRSSHLAVSLASASSDLRNRPPAALKHRLIQIIARPEEARDEEVRKRFRQPDAGASFAAFVRTSGSWLFHSGGYVPPVSTRAEARDFSSLLEMPAMADVAFHLVSFPLVFSAVRFVRIASYTLAQQKRAISALVMSSSLGFPVSSMCFTAR